MITLCLEGGKWPVWDGQAEVTKKRNGERRKSRRGIDLQDFFIPTREWVSLGELLSSIVSQVPESVCVVIFCQFV